MVKLVKTRRTLSKKDRLNIVWGLYGSLTNFRHQQYGASHVSRELGINVQTVNTCLKRL